MIGQLKQPLLCVGVALLALCPQLQFAQQNKVALRLYYGINAWQAETQAARIDSLVTALNAKTINLRIEGYADYLSNPAYNKGLSERRASEVKKYLLARYPSKINVLACNGNGDKASTRASNNEGEPAQRRVDIVLDRVVPVNDVDTRPVLIDPPTGTQTEEKEEADAEPVNEQKVKKASSLKLEKGKTVTLEGMSFEPGRHYMLRSSMPVLLKLLQILRENPELNIEIQGHVCCADGELDGMDYDTGERNLSVNRAKAIYDYLVKNGIRANRLAYKGFGHTKPKIDPERTKEDEQVNRRVEIMVLEE